MRPSRALALEYNEPGAAVTPGVEANRDRLRRDQLQKLARARAMSLHATRSRYAAQNRVRWDGADLHLRTNGSGAEAYANEYARHVFGGHVRDANAKPVLTTGSTCS